MTGWQGDVCAEDGNERFMVGSLVLSVVGPLDFGDLLVSLSAHIGCDSSFLRINREDDVKNKLR